MEPWISKYKKNTDDIMKDMPDSPSMSDLSSVQTPIVQPDTLVLASELTTRSRATSKNSKKSPTKSTPRPKATRQSRENVRFPNSSRSSNSDDDEYELTEIDDEIIRYNDPGPRHPSKKYSGFVQKSVTRMDTTGKLPTPSQSENTDEQFSQSFMDEIEQQKRNVDQHSYAVSQLQVYQQSPDKHEAIRKSKPGLPPRPPPPSREKTGIPDVEDSGDYEDDDDLKQPTEITETVGRGSGGLPPPMYDDDDHDLQTRDRGLSNLSGSSSGLGSLNSKDSSDISSMSKAKLPVKKKKQIIVGTDYNPDQPLVSVSSSLNVSQAETTTDTEQKEKETPVKKKKKKKKGAKPKVKSPFFASDAAVSKSKDKSNKTSPRVGKKKPTSASKGKGKDNKSTKITGKTTSTTTGRAALKSAKSTKGLKSGKDKKKTSSNPKSKDKDKGKSKAKDANKKSKGTGKSTSSGTGKGKSKAKSGKKGTAASKGMNFSSYNIRYLS